jgi:hypothetical protein
MFVLIGVLLLVVWHQYVLAIGTMTYVLWGALSALMRVRRRPQPPAA